IGAFISFLGVALIVAPSLGSQVQRLGYLYMGMAALAWVAYSFLTRGIASRYGKITVIFWQCLFGLIGCVPFALREAHAWKVPGTAVILNLLYLGVICSAAGCCNAPPPWIAWAPGALACSSTSSRWCPSSPVFSSWASDWAPSSCLAEPLRWWASTWPP
ncbi:MAG: EamA family transporter, partial [Holophaga sp.]|nr:EamA family transporter [Holophaga sp.]